MAVWRCDMWGKGSSGARVSTGFLWAWVKGYCELSLLAWGTELKHSLRASLLNCWTIWSGLELIFSKQRSFLWDSSYICLSAQPPGRGEVCFCSYIGLFCCILTMLFSSHFYNLSWFLSSELSSYRWQKFLRQSRTRYLQLKEDSSGLLKQVCSSQSEFHFLVPFTIYLTTNQ